MSDEMRRDATEERNRLPHAVPIKHDIFAFYDAMAKSEGTEAHVVINDTLRKHMEGVG